MGLDVDDRPLVGLGADDRPLVGLGDCVQASYRIVYRLVSYRISFIFNDALIFLKRVRFVFIYRLATV